MGQNHTSIIPTTMSSLTQVTTAWVRRNRANLYLSGETLAFAGSMATVVQATVKTIKYVEAHPRHIDEPKIAYAIDTAKSLWRVYIPPILSTTAFMVCLAGGRRAHKDQLGGVILALSSAQRALDNYRDVVEEAIGPVKARRLSEMAAVRTDLPVETPVIGKGTILCYDDHTGRYFESTSHDIRAAEITVNHEAQHGMYATLNHFYHEVGLPPVSSGDSMGWTSDKLLEITLGTRIGPQDTPCLVMVLNNLTHI